MRHVTIAVLPVDEVEEIALAVLERMVEADDQDSLGRLVDAADERVAGGAGATVPGVRGKASLPRPAASMAGCKGAGVQCSQCSQCSQSPMFPMFPVPKGVLTQLFVEADKCVFTREYWEHWKREGDKKEKERECHSVLSLIFASKVPKTLGTLGEHWELWISEECEASSQRIAYLWYNTAKAMERRMTTD